MSNLIPVTLLTGFLGAGKTTVLNHLLNDPKAGKIAVIVNEFGDAGLDHDLIEATAEEVVLMAAGCICCSIRGDLSRTLLSLLARRNSGELAFDRVVIETTGLADPGPVYHTLLVEPEVAKAFVLDGIVTVVDSVLGANTLVRHMEAQAQVAMADQLIVTKRDLATRADMRALYRQLDQLNPTATRYEANRGAVPLHAFIGLGIGKTPSLSDALQWLSQPTYGGPEDPLAGLSGLSVSNTLPVLDFGASSHHARDNRIATASIAIERPIPPSVFDFWLDTLIALRGKDILRMKGIVHLEDVPTPFVFHGVQHIFEPPVPLKGWPAGDSTSRVVLIARDLTQEELHHSLRTLLMRPEENDGLEGIFLHALRDPSS